MSTAPMSLDQIPGLTDSLRHIAHSDPAKGWSPLRRSEDNWEGPCDGEYELIDCPCGREVGGESSDDWVGYEVDLHGNMSCGYCVVLG